MWDGYFSRPEKDKLFFQSQPMITVSNYDSRLKSGLLNQFFPVMWQVVFKSNYMEENGKGQTVFHI